MEVAFGGEKGAKAPAPLDGASAARVPVSGGCGARQDRGGLYQPAWRMLASARLPKEETPGDGYIKSRNDGTLSRKR